jgi:hypothetical protein
VVVVVAVAVAAVAEARGASAGKSSPGAPRGTCVRVARLVAA